MAGFTKIENRILEKIITSNFTKRQLKILLFIVRFSFGCQKTYAIFKNKDFSYAGLSPYCIRNELEKLVSKEVIKWNPEKMMVWINQNLSDWSVKNSVKNSSMFFKIATKNLPKHQLRGYQNRKFRVHKTATFPLRKAEKNKPKQPLKENIKEKERKGIFKNFEGLFFEDIASRRRGNRHFEGAFANTRLEESKKGDIYGFKGK